MQATAGSFGSFHSITGELLALREGVVFAQPRGYSHVIMENDSIFFLEVKNFSSYFYRPIEKLYDEFGKIITLLLYGSGLMGGRKHLL